MEKIFRALSTRQRPVVFFPPLIDAHDENLDWLTRKFVLHTFKQVVIPFQGDFEFIVLVGSRSKINLSDLSAATSVTSDGHQKMLTFTRRVTSTVRFDPDIVAQRPALKNVVPSRDVKYSDI